ncbi:5-bromo-4-chloroindolyl phosphate hydrolysis family protein [Clostridium butyricum]|uniref:5-bromo-4-chloroindolyl phosphate hydrolysis family protein n=1 Tax=Clostridium butyricum TaxID=1492 RepID=UPI002AB12B49|nr:5-bromo-4-chloroindolyl phosphate hydrolysis family protein [Clostridium butyricum]
MNNNDFFDIENQIENAINSAFKYINYANRKATDIRENIMDNISDTAEDTIHDIKSKFHEGSDSIETKFQKMSEKFEHGVNKLNKKEQKEIYKYISKKPSGKYKGIIYYVLGITGSVAFAISFGACSILTMFNSKIIRLGVNMTLGTLFVFFVGSVILAFRGWKIRKRLERFNKYSDILKGKNYSEISKLSESVSKKNKFVLKDIEKMMSLNMFKEGHISEDKSYFILGDEVYEEYLNSMKAYSERSKEEADNTVEQDKSELSLVIENGEKYISEIESVNYSLHGNNICTKLNEMANITRNIIDNVRKNPDNLPLVKKFFNHYLPISLKLIYSYRELNTQTIEGENIRKAKNEIENSIDLINTAFRKLLDNLFEDVVLDVSSDISVLETLFTQEGLTEDDFKKKNK